MKKTLFLIPALLLAATAQAAPKASSAFNVAPLKNIVLDGQANDWQQSVLAVDVLTDLDGKPRSAVDSSAPIAVGYDERGLLVLIHWHDDHTEEADEAANLWQKDSLELFVANRVGGTEAVQILIGSGRDSRFPTPRVQVIDKRQNTTLQASPSKIETAIKNNSNEATVEALIPWAYLGINATQGTEIGFQLIVNDVDSGPRQQMMWFPQTGTSSDTSKMASLRLSDKADAPVRVVVSGGQERFRRVVANVTGTQELTGQRVEVRAGKKVLGRGQMEVATEGRSSAKVRLPLPPHGRNYGPLRVRVGKERETTLLLPDLEKERQEYILYAPLKFEKYVFTKTEFPTADFEQPSVMEDALGPYSIHTSFYDSDYNLVQRAEKPGRYGAVVEIRPETGKPFRKYITLYKQPKEFNWQQKKPRFSAELPPELGVDAEVLKARGATISDYLMWRFVDGYIQEPDSGAWLSGLSEAKAGEPEASWNNPFSRDQIWRYGLMKKLNDIKPLPYLLDLPKDYEADKNKKWPLVLFLHGSGERGSDLSKVRAHGPPMLVAQSHEFPFILASPQVPTDGLFLAPQLAELLDEVQAKYRVDVDRVYVTGLSMGGSGTFYLAWEYPERFAAIAPMAAAGDPRSAYRIKNLPTWFFVGGKDGTVPERAEKTVAAMREVGVPLKYTLYPDADHGQTWKNAYNDPAFYEWLLAQKRTR